MNYSDKLKKLKIRIEKKNNYIKMINVDEYIKKNVSLEHYDDELKNLMIKIEHKQEEIYKSEKNGILNLNDLKEYHGFITELFNKLSGLEKGRYYCNFILEHLHNFNNNKRLIAMTTSDINTLNEIMKDENPFTNSLIPYNPNVTEEMLKELSKT